MRERSFEIKRPLIAIYLLMMLTQHQIMCLTWTKENLSVIREFQFFDECLMCCSGKVNLEFFQNMLSVFLEDAGVKVAGMKVYITVPHEIMVTS